MHFIIMATNFKIKTAKGISNNPKVLYFRTIRRIKSTWIETLYSYLSRYGVTSSRCKMIALFKMDDALDCYDEGKHLEISKVFPEIKSICHAVAIYNAYVRHHMTNYDDFGEYVRSFTKEKMPKEDFRKLWEMRFPEEYYKYQSNCIHIDSHFKRVPYVIPKDYVPSKHNPMATALFNFQMSLLKKMK